MPNETSILVEEIRKQNDLLQKMYELQNRQERERKRSEHLRLAVQILPFVIILLIIGYLYWQISSSLNGLTTQVTNIRTNVESTYGLLAQQFEHMNEYFSGLVTNLKGLVPDLPNFREVPNLIEEQFLSS